VGVASYKMIRPDHRAAASAALAPTVTPAPVHHRKAAHHKPRPLTHRQKAARAAAVAEVRRQGYTALRPSDYDPRATFRVLIGRPAGDSAGGAYAFFFRGGHYLGRDSLSPSASVKVIGQTRHSVVLAYRTCCPAKRVPVRFRLEPQGVHALQAVPPSYLRAVRR
jgi:hypothetical protein